MFGQSERMANKKIKIIVRVQKSPGKSTDIHSPRTSSAQGIELRECNFEAPALLDEREGNIQAAANARLQGALHSHRPQARRETSCTRTGRPPNHLATNVSRTACEGRGCMTSANRTEESDCAVVPKNLPNKGAPTHEGVTAEAGERQAWTKENSSQIHTIPTLCDLSGGKVGDGCPG
jgi:hypothetical protein